MTSPTTWTLAAEATREMWTLHDLPDHTGGAMPRYAPPWHSNPGQLLGWQPICSCGWRTDDYALRDQTPNAEDSNDPPEVALFRDLLRLWFGHFTFHMTTDKAFDEVFLGDDPDPTTSIICLAAGDIAPGMHITRPKVTHSLNWTN